jgi:hypothetical protein
MTALGKVLVFVVLLLALVWNALVVNAYTTRVNWKGELEKTKEKLAQATDAANAERRRADESRAAADAVLAQLRKQVGDLTTSKETLEKTLDETQKKLAIIQKTEEETQKRDAVANTNTLKTQKIVEMLQKQLDSSEKEKNDAVIRAQKMTNDALQARINERSEKRRADELEGKLLKANDPNRGTGGVGATRPQVDRDFKATVTSVEGETVIINLGANARLQKGSVLQLSRTKPDPKFVGTLTITSVDPFYAVGRFTAPANVVKPTADDLPKAGDTVSVID